MTIKYPEKFESAAPAGFDGKFDWDFLLPAFAPTKIEPMDWDAVIERKGRFLVFETKSGELPIPQGQIIALEAAAKTGFFTIIILRAKSPPDIQGWDCWFLGNGVLQKRHQVGDAAALVEFIRRWFVYANNNLPAARGN